MLYVSNVIIIIITIILNPLTSFLWLGLQQFSCIFCDPVTSYCSLHITSLFYLLHFFICTCYSYILKFGLQPSYSSFLISIFVGKLSSPILLMCPNHLSFVFLPLYIRIPFQVQGVFLFPHFLLYLFLSCPVCFSLTSFQQSAPGCHSLSHFSKFLDPSCVVYK